MFSIKPNQIIKICDQIFEITSKLNQQMIGIENSISALETLSGTDKVISSLKNQFFIIDEEYLVLCNMEMALNNVMILYSDCEKRICDNANDKKGFNFGDTEKNKVQVEQKEKEDKEYDFLYSFFKAYFTFNEKSKLDDSAGIEKGLLEYFKEFWDFFGEKKDISGLFELADSSSSLWNEFYKFLEKKDATGILRKQWGERAAGIEVIGSLLGLLATIYNTTQEENINNGKKWKNFFEILEEGTDFSKDIYDLFTYNEAAQLEEGLYTEAGLYIILIKTILSSVGQAGESISVYYEDGIWDMNDTSRTCIEVSVSGLNSLISGLTYGIISAETFGTTPEEIYQNIENVSAVVGQSAGEYIYEHSEMRDKWNSGNVFNRIGLIVEAMYKQRVG